MNEKTVKKIIPIQDFSSPYLCVWLQEMSEQGLILKSLGSIFAVFEKSTPMKRRYRTIYTKFAEMDEAEKSIYEESGWRLFPANAATIAMTSDERAPEPFTDSDSYFRHRKLKWFWYPLGIIASLGLCFHWVWRTFKDSPFYDADYINKFGKLHASADSRGLLAILIVFLIAMIAIWGLNAVEEIRMLKFFLGKKTPDYNISYKDRGYTASKIMRYTQYVACCVIIINIFFELIIGFSLKTGTFESIDQEAALKYDGDHPVMLSEIDPESWGSIKPYITDYADNSPIYYDYMICLENNKYIKDGRREQLWITEVIDEDSDRYEYLFHYYSFYGQAKDADTAMEWLGEEATFDINEKVQGYDTAKVLNEIKIECEGVDYAGYVATPRRDIDKYDYQRLYLRKDRNIRIVTYCGPVDLKSKLDVFVNEFN